MPDQVCTRTTYASTTNLMWKKKKVLKFFTLLRKKVICVTLSQKN